MKENKVNVKLILNDSEKICEAPISVFSFILHLHLPQLPLPLHGVSKSILF